MPRIIKSELDTERRFHCGKIISYKNVDAWEKLLEHIVLEYTEDHIFMLSGFPHNENAKSDEEQFSDQVVHVQVSKEWVCKLLDQIEQSKIPVFVFDHSFGMLDGESKELILHRKYGWNDDDMVIYRWHENSSWGRLERIADIMIEEFYAGIKDSARIVNLAAKNKMNDEKYQKKLNKSLIEACGKQDYMQVSSLLDAGADPNAVDDDNWESALTTLIDDGVFWENSSYGFVSQDFWRIMEVMLKKGADVNLVLKTSDGEINTALFSAQYTIPEVMKYLLEHGADPDFVNDEGETVLDAVETRQFISKDRNLDEFDEEWDDSMYHDDNIQIRNILLDHGAHCASTLELLKKMKRWNVAKREIYLACFLLNADALSQALSEYHIDVTKGKYHDLAWQIIERSPEFRRKDFIGNLQGFENAQIKTLKVLLDHGYDINVNGGDALISAVQNGYLTVTHFLLNHGADPEKCDCGSVRNVETGEERIYTIPEKVLAWRGRWTKETALKFQTLFPLPDQAQS